MVNLEERHLFANQVYAIIAAIPSGKVITYGQIAKMTGLPTYIRQVCFVLRHLPKDNRLPCHRIVNHQGRLSVKNDTYTCYKQKLIAEGVEFTRRDKIDLNQFGWQPWKD